MSNAAAERLRALPIAAIADAAGGMGVLSPLIVAQTRVQGTVVAPAYTVALPRGDNLGLHQAVVDAPAGAALVAMCTAEDESAIWGEILAAAAAGSGIAVFVTDGWVRDRSRLEEIGIATYARGVCIRRTAKDAPGARQVAIEIGGVRVTPGDLVCAGEDGVVIVPAADAADVTERAEAIVAKEERVLEEVRRGVTTLAALGLELEKVHV